MGCEQYRDPFGSLGPISLMKTLTNSRGATRLLDLRRSPSMVRKLHYSGTRGGIFNFSRVRGVGTPDTRRLLAFWYSARAFEVASSSTPEKGSAQNRANLYAKRFRVGACWIGAGIDRYEDELEFPRWTSIHASSSPRRPGCAPRISGSYARHDDLTTNLAWRTRSPSSGSRGGRRASNLSRSSRTSWVMWQRS